MRTEGVVLDRAAPVVVSQRGTLVLRTDTVHPVVVVGKTAAWPAQHGHLQSLQRLKNVLAIALDVRNLRVLAHPEAAIDTGAEVL